MGSLIRRVSRTMQTAMNHNWEGETPEQEVIEYMYDPRNPKEFYVYPPNDGTGVVRAVYTRLPDPLQTIAQIGSEVAWGAQELPIPDEYAEAIANFVLHRAFSKDTEWARDDKRALHHFELYLEMIGVKAKADQEWSQTGGE